MTVRHMQCTVQRGTAVRRPSREAGYCICIYMYDIHVCIIPVIGMCGAVFSPPIHRKMFEPSSTQMYLM